MKNEINNINDNFNRRTSGWMQTLITLVFIVVPAIMFWIFFTGDWQNDLPLNIGELFGVAFGFVAYSFLITWFFILLDIAWYDMFNFTVPIAIVLMGIMLSYPWPLWARALLTIGLVLFAWPINMFSTWYTEKKLSKLAKRE
ncbi:MAG: hypothetical protein NC236_01310 [Mycoplasma sp.]|nr:hypothetical protein [Mycoplasma sp.]